MRAGEVWGAAESRPQASQALGSSRCPRGEGRPQALLTVHMGLHAPTWGPVSSSSPSVPPAASCPAIPPPNPTPGSGAHIS